MLVVRADCTYSHTGEGPAPVRRPGRRQGLPYSQFEVPDARRVFTTFEQPDLKAPFTFTVTAPAHWKVVPNFPHARAGAHRHEQRAGRGPGGVEPRHPAPVDLHHRRRRRRLLRGPGRLRGARTARSRSATTPASPLRSTSGATATRSSPSPSRASPSSRRPSATPTVRQVRPALRAGVQHGAMENAGCVTLRDEYLPPAPASRARSTSSAPGDPARDGAHVVRRPGHHEVVGRPVAQRVVRRVGLLPRGGLATSYDDAWTGFTNARKQTGYRADSLPSTHPIAADNVDLHAVEVNFDMITYAKGRLGAQAARRWVGLEPFLAGLKQYFHDHEFGNTEFSDLLTALEKASGRELRAGPRVAADRRHQHLSPPSRLTEAGHLRLVRRPPGRPAEPRPAPAPARDRLLQHRGRAPGPHRLRRGRRRGRAHRAARAGRQAQPELLLLNDQDLGLRQDPPRRALAGHRDRPASDLDDSLARALCGAPHGT